MACFLVPAAEAVVTSVIKKTTEKKGTSRENIFLSRIGWLNNILLGGGSALLAFEHLWHGEITPLFPFLTNMSSPANMAEMLGEMATSGVGMAALVTAVWAIMTAAADYISKEPLDETIADNTEIL